MYSATKLSPFSLCLRTFPWQRLGGVINGSRLWFRAGRIWLLHAAVRKQHDVLCVHFAPVDCGNTVLQTFLQEYFTVTSSGEEKMGKNVHIHNGKEIKAGRTATAETQVRLYEHKPKLIFALCEFIDYTLYIDYTEYRFYKYICM